MHAIARGSVRRQLLMALLAGLTLVWLVGGGVSVYQMQSQVRDLLDSNLKQSAAPLLHEVEEKEPDDVFSVFRFSSQLVFQIWRDGNQLVLRSNLAPTQPLTNVTDGFSDSTVADHHWRTFSAWDNNHRYLVIVAQRNAERGALIHEIAGQLIHSLLLMLPLFAFVVWFAVGVALRPLDRLSDEVAQRDANNLQPITGFAPREIQPLIQRLNDLLKSLFRSLEGERRFTADASHELRTPLAAIKSQIQVAIGAHDAAQQQRALTQALQACDIATHRVEQMLTLSRLEQEIWRENIEIFDMRDVAVQVIGEVAPVAVSKHIELVLDASASMPLRGRAALWTVLLKNLLDNAIRWAPQPSTVIVSVEKSADTMTLTVTDEGPGIAPEKIDSAFARFERLGKNDPGGSGLGLSIVARIVELHRARIELLPGKNGRGLSARVHIPIDQVASRKN